MRVMVLTDRKRIVITDAEEKLISSRLDKSGDRITVKGIPYKKSMVGYFDDPTHEELQGIQSVLNVFPGAKELNDGLVPGCKAQYSIQLAIIGVAKEYSGKHDDTWNPETAKWSKLLQDHDWKDMIRQLLWKQSDKWCDYKLKKCACEPGFRPSAFNPGKIL